jgi:hypothetical protein
VSGDARLRFRVYLGGVLADEVWIDAADPGSRDLATMTAIMQADLCQRAALDGVPWLLEVYDPGAPPGASCLRLGTDADGMVYPVPLVADP